MFTYLLILTCARDCSGNPGVASLLRNMFNRLPRSARNDGLQRKARPASWRGAPSIKGRQAQIFHNIIAKIVSQFYCVLLQKFEI